MNATAIATHSSSSLVAIVFLSCLHSTTFLAYLSFREALFWQVKNISRLSCAYVIMWLCYIHRHSVSLSKAEYKTSSSSPSCPITQNLSHKHTMALNIASRNRYIITNSQTGTVMDLSGSDSKSGMFSPHIWKCLKKMKFICNPTVVIGWTRHGGENQQVILFYV